jgi:hypothetical protein
MPSGKLAGGHPNHGGPVTKYDLLLSRVRWLESRMRAVEAAQAAHPVRRKRVAAARPTNAIVTAREKLWARYVLLDVSHRGRITKLAFAMRHRLNPDEFCRWFSATDRRGIPEGSDPDRRFRQALTDAISELEARARGGEWKSKTHDGPLIAASVQ